MYPYQKLVSVQRECVDIMSETRSSLTHSPEIVWCLDGTMSPATLSLALLPPSSSDSFFVMGQHLNCAWYSDTNCFLWWRGFLWWWLLFLPLGSPVVDSVFGGSFFGSESSFLLWDEMWLLPFFKISLPCSDSPPIGSACSSAGSLSWGFSLRGSPCCSSTGSSVAPCCLSVWVWVGWLPWWSILSALRRGDSNSGVFHVYWSWYTVGVLMSARRNPDLYLNPLSSCRECQHQSYISFGIIYYDGDIIIYSFMHEPTRAIALSYNTQRWYKVN